MGRFFLFTKTTVTREWKVKKWAVDKIWDPIAKNEFSGQKPSLRAQEKRSLLDSDHVLARTGKSCTNKKYPFPKKYLLAIFFWGGGIYFWSKKHFAAKRKNGLFSVIPAWTRSVVIVGHLFDGLDGPTKFRWPRSKIKGTYNSKVGMAQNGQKPGWAPKNDPQLGNRIFFGVFWMGKL